MLRGNYCAAWFPLNHWRVVTILQEFQKFVKATVAEEWATQYPKESGPQITSANHKIVQSADLTQICQFTDLRADPVIFCNKRICLLRTQFFAELNFRKSTNTSLFSFSKFSKYRLKMLYFEILT
jgi:hypothetical protein